MKSCGIDDGSTVAVASRRRGGGKHTDKKSKAEETQAASAKRPEALQVEEAIQEMITCILGGSDVEGEQRLQGFLATIQKLTGWTNDKWRTWNVGSDRWSRRIGEKVSQREQVADQEQDKKVRVREEEQSEETRAQSSNEQDVTSWF